MTELEKKAEELAYKWWHSVDKEFVDVIDAYVQGYKDAVEKACEWLKFNYAEFTDNTRLGIKIDELIKDFKQAMEEQL